MGTFASSIALIILTSPIWIFLISLPLAGSMMVGKKVMNLLFKFRVFKPRLSKQDRLWLMRQELKDHDTEKIGFNPIKYNYSIFELFPKQPDSIVVNEWRKKIFSLSDLKSEPLERSEKIKYWYSIFLAMALMRSDMQKQKTWSSVKEQMWLQFPFRPKAMKEVDPAYLRLFVNDTWGITLNAERFLINWPVRSLHCLTKVVGRSITAKTLIKKVDRT